MAQGIGRVVVDSFHELDLLNRVAAEAGKVQDILVRVSPGIDPHTHAYTTTGIIDSKFGFRSRPVMRSGLSGKPWQRPT